MNKFNLKLTFLYIFILVVSSSFSVTLLGQDPMVEDITVCEGESTLIVPSVTGLPPKETVATEDFSAAAGNLGFTPSVMFNDSNNDHFQVTDGSDISNVTGVYSFVDGTNLFFAAEDVDDNGGDGNAEQSVTFDPVDITNLTNLCFSFDLAAGNENPQNTSPGYDAGDHLFVEYSIDGGANFIQGLCFRANEGTDAFNDPLHQDVDCDGNGDDGVQILNEAQTFLLTVPTADTDGAASIIFRILVQMTSASEEVAFDNIEILGVPSGATTFNFYDDDPGVNPGATLLATNVTSFDPMTTPADSPESIWVTAVNANGESEAVEVIVTVFPNTDAGDNQFSCGLVDFELEATGDPGLTPQWTGGMGTFSDDGAFITNYTPATSEIGTTITITFNLPGALCGETDELTLYIAEEANSEFSYQFDTICPGDGILAPMFTNGGVSGQFSVTDGIPANLALDPTTGEIDITNSFLGTYEISNVTSACGNAIITGVIDGPITGGLPKAIEFYATADIFDLSMYGFGSANNGGGTDGEEFTFPSMFIPAGTYFYVSTESIQFNTFFQFTSGVFFVDNFAASLNGDDAIELFCNGEVIDVFGEIDVDGTGQPWEHLDGWAYRNSGDSINLGSFDVTQWSFSGPNALDGETDNATAAIPMPVMTFETSFTSICPNDTTSVMFTIDDMGGPMINCPNDLTINLGSGECGQFVPIADIMAIDNCTPDLVFEQTEGPMSGDFLSLDESPYTITFEGTTSTGELISCSYMIFVTEFESINATLACNGSVNVSLDENCEALITAATLLEGNNYGCFEDYVVTAEFEGNSVGVSVPNSIGSGSYLLLDNTILNQPIEVSITDPENGNSCWGFVIIEDKFDPIIVCPDTLVVPCDADITPVEPEVLDNCGATEFIMEEDIIDGECTDDFFQEIVRTWIAIDAAGNVSDECIQVIRLERDNFDEIIFPLNYDGLPGNNEALECNGEGSQFALDEEGRPSPIPSNNLIGTGEPMLGAGCSNLLVYYEDEILPTCGNSYKVLRSWSAVDWCTGQTADHVQVIKILDDEAPLFTVPEDVTVATDGHCRGSYILPLVNPTDNCNTTITSYSAAEGSIEGLGFYIESPVLGQAYNIDITVTDACDNDTTQTFTVTFVDLTAPVVIAESYMTVALSLDGTAKVFATNIDDGSYDTCGPVEFSAIRTFSTCAPIDYDEPAGDDNFQFNEIVHFCCDDIGTPQMVTFRVCDDAGTNGVFGDAGDNCNTQMIEVNVQNKLAPVLICPAPDTISCFDAASLDLTNGDLMDEMFGEVSIQNACGGATFQNAILVEECGEGLIIRSFFAIGGGDASTCSQFIAVIQEDENKLTCDRINFAELNNNIYNWCSVNDNNNDNDDDLPAIEIDCNDGLIIPELDLDINGLCTEVGEKISIDTFNFAGGACKKYLIHYEVIDQCVFDENFVNDAGENDPFDSNNGYFEFYIEVDAFDNDGPIIDSQDMTFVAENCTSTPINVGLIASDVCTSQEFLSFQYRIDLNSDNVFDLPTTGYLNGQNITTGQNGIGEFPVGVHTVYILVADGCGNTSTLSQLITITENEKEPTPYCKTGLIASISAMGMVSVTADQLDAGSFDNCTDSDDLIFSFSPDVNDTERMYTCDDRGFQFIQIYVTDEDGNQDFCNTSFLVQDNLDFCDGMLVVGSVTSPNGYMNKNAEVILTELENMMDMVMTDETGNYELESSSFSNEALLHVEDNNDLLNGVTGIDIIFIQKHILGLTPFTTNHQLIAADVDNNGKINGLDIIQIRKALLGYNELFNNNFSWATYPADVDIESLSNPYDYPRSINIMSTNMYDFNAIKVADVNDSHNPGFSENIVDTRSTFKIEYKIVDIDGINKEIIFSANVNDLVGLSIVSNDFNNDNIKSIEAYNLEINEEFYNINEELKLLWNGSIDGSDNVELFSITYNGNKTIQSILDNSSAEVYLGKGTMTSEESVEFVERRTDKELTGELSVFPNPFSNSTVIDLQQIEYSEVELEVFDAKGQLLFVQSYRGQDQIVLDESQISSSGVYFIQISNGNIVINKRILKIE